MLEIFGGILVLALMISFSGIKVVKEHERLVVFRFGRLNRSCSPGLRLILPLVEQASCVDVRQQEILLPELEMVAVDGIHLSCSAMCTIRIKDVLKVVSATPDLNKAVSSALSVSLGETLSSFPSSEFLQERRRVNAHLKRLLVKKLGSLGVVLLTAEIVHIHRLSPVERA